MPVPNPTSVQRSDEELAVEAASDPDAFALLYERYLDRVYRFAYRRLGNREEAEDLTSLIFVRVLSALPRFHDGRFRSWLFTIAHNAIVDHLRSRRPTEGIEGASEVVAGTPTPEEIAIGEEERSVVRELLSHLSWEQRQVVELRLAGLTGPEIRCVLGRSRAWVDTTQYRAMQRLRAVMAMEGSAKEASDDG